MSSKLILIGGGGHAKTCLDVISYNNDFVPTGIISLSSEDNLTQLEWVGNDDAIFGLSKSVKDFFISIGQIRSPKPREAVGKILDSLGLNTPSFISPSASVARSARIGAGTIVFPNSYIGADVNIGRHVIVGSGAVVEHDSIVEDYCHIATGGIVNGECKIGYGSFVGAGAVLRNQISITTYSFIKMGAIVTHDVPN